MLRSPFFATRRPEKFLSASSSSIAVPSSPYRDYHHPGTFGGRNNLVGCAVNPSSKTRRCHSVAIEQNDPDVCVRSPKNRCVRRTEPRKCEYYQPSPETARCRSTQSPTQEHDRRCYVSPVSNRCTLAVKSPRKKRASKRAVKSSPREQSAQSGGLSPSQHDDKLNSPAQPNYIGGKWEKVPEKNAKNYSSIKQSLQRTPVSPSPSTRRSPSQHDDDLNSPSQPDYIYDPGYVGI
jgi:hypothetical protein